VETSWLYFSTAVIGLAILGVAIIFAPTEGAIPPTPAFNRVVTGISDYSAKSYNEVILVPKYAYAQLSDLTTQQCAANGAASNVTISTNDSIYGIAHSTTTNTQEITFQSKGTYLVIASPQVGEAQVQADGIHNFWMMKNGEQVPNSNIIMTVHLTASGADTMVNVLNTVGYFEAGDVIYFQQSCTDEDIGIIFTASATPPNTPSIIISVAKLDW
jgi:hypothetical protein